MGGASGRDAGLLQGHRYWRWRGRRNPRHLLHGRAAVGPDSGLRPCVCLLPKIKSATDTVVVAGSNLDKNYGFTSKIDEQLKISQAIDKVTSKVDELKSSVTGKVEDLKAKATE